MLVRNGDLRGLSLIEDDDQSNAWGIAIGRSRIVWYLLLMSAYLAAIGRIKSQKKEVILVCYDVRDIEVGDVGLSGVMLQTIEMMKKRLKDPIPLTKLSDLLIWLSKQGFRVRLCVDNKVLGQERPVRELLDRLDASGSSGIELYTKDIPTASMHGKGLLTPIGAISGSMNLTTSGTLKNDEFLDFSVAQTPGYKSMRSTFEDVIRKAERWGRNQPKH